MCPVVIFGAEHEGERGSDARLLSCLCRGVKGEKGSVLLSCLCRARGMGVWEQYRRFVCISREEDNDKHARVEPAGSEYKAEELVNWEGSTNAGTEL